MVLFCDNIQAPLESQGKTSLHEVKTIGHDVLRYRNHVGDVCLLACGSHTITQTLFLSHLQLEKSFVVKGLAESFIFQYK